MALKLLYLAFLSLIFNLNQSSSVAIPAISENNSSLIYSKIFLILGVATGTVLYVVFFEIIPKGKTVGGTGKQHIAAMILGFAIFLPSLYFR